MGRGSVANRVFMGIALSLVASAGALAAEHRLTLSPTMLINEVAVGDAAGLVDEQEVIGDPAAGKGIAPKRPFFPGWQAWAYPVSVAVDLGAKHRVSRVYFYNETGKNEIVVSTGEPFRWTAKPVTLDAYRGWVEVPVNAETRWLRVTLPKPVSLPEMVVYGEATDSPKPLAPRAAPKPRPHPTMDQFIGANVFIDDPLGTIAPVSGFAREYHNWSWDLEGADHKRRFQPSGAAGGNAWFFDDYYRSLKQRGVTVSPAIQNSVPELFGGGRAEYKPVVAGADAEDARSYAMHSAHLFQYAARYGSRAVPDSQLELAAGQPRKSGLGLLRYIENWNEPDRTWNDRQGRFHPYELAAMCSADRDGNLGKMGAGKGVRTADPSMKLVLGGLTGMNLPYLRAMKFWADYNRGGSFPADVINIHHYSNTGNEQGFQPNGHGISPEDDHLREKMVEVARWRDTNVPDAELWMTEFGYDTNPASPLHAPKLGSLSAEQVQAAWLVRPYFALAAAGVDRAAMFMLRDVKSTGGGVFETCGLVTEKGQWKPKPSYHAVAALRRTLAGYRFSGEVRSGNPDVRVYRFEKAAATPMFAVWCATSEDKHVLQFRLPVGGKTATVFVLADGATAKPLTVRDGYAMLDVSEVPVLVTGR
jgi:hypothetical protein